MQPHNTAQTGQHGPADEVLLSEVRQGKLESYGVLYERYASMARAIAYRHTENGTLAEDIVSEAFVRILQALKNGKGPRTFMGGYLATTIAHLAAENGLIAQKEIPSEQYQLESFGSLDETVLKLHESDELISAFTALPERWQSILWMTEVENKKPREVASAMNLSANAVSALASRARESLREGFLRAHQHAPKTVECSHYSPHLSSMVRGSLTKKRSEALRAHLSMCSSCSAEYFTLIGINQSMRTWVFPVLTGLPPLLTDGSKVLLPYLTGEGLAALGGAAHEGLSGLAMPVSDRWGASNQSLIGAAAVVTAIGAVAGGIALFNNSAPNSAIISADSQLGVTPIRNVVEDAGAVTDTLVDSSHIVASSGSISPFEVPLSPTPWAPFVPEAVEPDLAHEDSPQGIPSLSQLSPKGFAWSSQEGGKAPAVKDKAPAKDKTAGLGSIGGLTLGQSFSLFASVPAPKAADVTPEVSGSAPTPEVIPWASGTVAQPVAPTSPNVPAEGESPQPASSVNDSADKQASDTSVTPEAPEPPAPPSDSAKPKPDKPTSPGNPSERDKPKKPTPSEPGIPDILDPFTWIGTAEYYAWMAQVPWDTIGRPVGGNRMCSITYIESGSLFRFGTYIPPMILDSPYVFYVLEGYYGLREIAEINCY